MDESGDETKTASWATVLMIAAGVFFVIGLLWKQPTVWLFSLVLVGAGAVSQFVSSRRR